ncbi:lasso RiPP family leader peptide-containing protein [Haloechinothrix salitolerans]|uniref:Lasso RiPP family leader peptide-containing protein n=1 Tax=Haloechinothrix salitolerans TaxID=926830 RepID=A0ABW2C4L7_9PSEU
MRSEYVAPEIEELGTVAELTLGEAEGSKLDADFAAGTLFGDITFS